MFYPESHVTVDHSSIEKRISEGDVSAPSAQSTSTPGHYSRGASFGSCQRNASAASDDGHMSSSTLMLTRHFVLHNSK